MIYAVKKTKNSSTTIPPLTLTSTTTPLPITTTAIIFANGIIFINRNLSTHYYYAAFLNFSPFISSFHLHLPPLIPLRFKNLLNRIRFCLQISPFTGVRECFSEINTNPCYVEEDGRLRIMPCHSTPHGCSLCPPNMCKGFIIERIKAMKGMKKIIYLGDGAGDFCPSLKLSQGDYMMPRKDFPVWELIKKNEGLVKAEIHEWCDGEELEQILIGTILIQEKNNIRGGEHLFKFGHEALPQPLPVSL